MWRHNLQGFRTGFVRSLAEVAVAVVLDRKALFEHRGAAGNGTRGLYLWAFGAPGISSQIRIQGNYIGTDVTGTVGLGARFAW